jgi:hypothetical protein
MKRVLYLPGTERTPRQLPPLMSDDLLGARLLLEASGNDDDGLGPVELSELGYAGGRLGRGDHHDEEVDLLGQRGEVRHAGAAVDLGGARLDDVEPPGIEAVREEVAQDDAAVVHPLLGDADDRGARGLEELVYLGEGAGGLGEVDDPAARRAEVPGLGLRELDEDVEG